MSHNENDEFFKGRGAQTNVHNKFLKQRYVTEHSEGLDEAFFEDTKTQLFFETPKKIISVSNSPDLPNMHSINPYQGCEHGCLYCYARNSHEYYGFSAGLDFERKIIVKKDAAKVLEKQFMHPKYEPGVIMLSGNTDCYQPIERKFRITRSLLEVFLRFKHPVGIISKNILVRRDLDLLIELSKLDLVHVTVTINSLRESLRKKLEPRTASAGARLSLIRTLSENNIPVRLMLAPIVPGLNSNEIPEVIKAAADAGVQGAIFTVVRLNGAIAEVFNDWIHKAYPDRAEKVLHMIAECHGGTLNDSRWGKRISGDGKVAESIHQLFRISVNRFLKGRSLKPYNLDLFERPQSQMKLF
ncbi:MAG: PA0069 family radical SAM protein [Mucilaginibacter polytrichastri]|nr:PA0069 family radical SAM protein [Mucilaginibacter polytrichastri]